MAAECFELLVQDVQSLLREFAGRKGQPTAICLDSRTLQSTPESGARAGYDGAKRRKGSKVHIAVDTLGHLMALTVTAADEGDRAQVAAVAKQVQQVTGDSVDLAYVDQGYTGENAADAAAQHGIRLEVVKHPMAKRGFVLLPRRWVVERSSPGPHASAGSRATTNDLTLPSKASTISASPASCSHASSICSTQHHNRLQSILCTAPASAQTRWFTLRQTFKG